MDDCGGENNGRARKNWDDRADQTDGEEDDREEPPKEFVNREIRCRFNDSRFNESPLPSSF